MNRPMHTILGLLVATAVTAATWTAEPVALEVVERAVGTVRARTEARVMAQASGRVLEVLVREGDAVEEGQALARIDDRELALRLAQARRGVEAAQAALGQAEQGLRAASAALTQARSEHERVQGFRDKGAATPQQMEAAEAAFQQARAGEAQARHAVEAARAGLRRAEEGVAEVEVLRAYTRVVAPMAGTIASRDVEPGDLAWPGRPLLRIHTPDELVLEAHVREGLVAQVQPGARVRTRVGDEPARAGRVLELVPLADPVSRKVTVKVALDAPEGVVPGMFGRLEVPVGVRAALLLPPAAVHRHGQLTSVRVMTPKGPTRRLVRLGEAHAGGVEVLAGLEPGEVVEVPEATP